MMTVSIHVLRLHPQIAGDPCWRHDDPRLEALRESIRQRGIETPLVIDEENRIMDGRHRFWAAQSLKIQTVPCVTRPSSEAAEIAIHSLVERRHYTKSQRAYIAARHLAAAFRAAQQRHQDNLRAGQAATVHGMPTAEHYASVLGICPRLLKQGIQLHDIWDERLHFTFVPSGAEARKNCERLGLPTDAQIPLRDYFEAIIMDEEKPAGLGGVIAGIGSIIAEQEKAAKHGIHHTGGVPKELQRQLELFSQVVETEIKRWEYWSKFDDETKSAHWQSVRQRAAELPPDRCADLADYHRRMANEFAKAARRDGE